MGHSITKASHWTGGAASSPSAYLEHRVRELQEALEKQDRDYGLKVQGLQQKFSAIEVSGAG